MRAIILSLVMLVFSVPSLAIDCVPLKLSSDASQLVTYNEDGKLIIHVFDQLKSGKKFPVVLKREYGIMVFNEGTALKPIGRYELSSQNENSIQIFNSFNELKTALSKLPKNSKIDLYDKCTVPTFYGLINFQEEELIKYCKDSGLNISGQRFITCTCPE